MNKYHQTFQAFVDRQRELVGNGNWKVSKYSADWALVEHFIAGKWVAQGSIPASLLK